MALITEGVGASGCSEARPCCPRPPSRGPSSQSAVTVGQAPPRPPAALPLPPQVRASLTFQLLLHAPELLEDGADLLEADEQGGSTAGLPSLTLPQGPRWARSRGPGFGDFPGSPRSRAGWGRGALTLLDVFRMGTSFSALILASKSSHARPEFWKRILSPEELGREQAEDSDHGAPHGPSQATPPATGRPSSSPTRHKGKLRPRAGPRLVAPASRFCA